MSLPFVSVVMPVRGEVEWIERAVHSVLDQRYDGALEILVVIAAGSDATRRIVESMKRDDPRIHIIINPSGRTPSALNIGIRAAKGNVIARVDAHGWLGQGYLASAIKVMDRTGVAAVGGRVEFVGLSRVGRAIAIAESTRIGSGGAAFRVAHQEMTAEALRWGVFRRELFEQVGFFDEALVRNQDDEFCHRLVIAGYRLLVTPEMRFTQVVRSSLRMLWSQYAQWGEFRVATIAKHRRPATARQLAPPLFVAAAVTAVGAEVASRGRIPVGRRLAFVYGLVVAIPGSTAAVRAREYSLTPLVPAAIVAMHVAYGVGFWRGVARRALSWIKDSLVVVA